MSFAQSELTKRKLEEIENDCVDEFMATVKSQEKLADMYQEWARLLEASGTMEVNEICAYIGNRMIERTKKAYADSWVTKVLPEKYKGNYSKADSPLLTDAPELEIPLAKLTKDQAIKRHKIQKNNAKEHKFRARLEENDATEVEHILNSKYNVDTDGDEKKVTSTQSNPGESAPHIKLVKLIETLEKLEKKMYKFKPVKYEAEIERELTRLYDVFLPLVDEKWTESLPVWFRIQQLNIAHGKHGAGSLGATIAIDGTKRNMTREQVGDKFNTVMEMACRILDLDLPDESDGEAQEAILKQAEAELGPNGIMWLYVLSVLWHKESVAPYIAQRKVDMHDKFSESS